MWWQHLPAVSLQEAEGDGLGLVTSSVMTLTRKWTAEGVGSVGTMTYIGLLVLDDLKPELINHDVILVRA